MSMLTRATAAGGGQLDMFAAQDTADTTARAARVAPCLFRSPARGLAARAAEYQEWISRHGNFGASYRAHAWDLNVSCPGAPTDRCQPTVLSVDTRPPFSEDQYEVPCDCWSSSGKLLWRGACRRCDWEGAPAASENPAAEAACDHAWPGWRDLPVVRDCPGEQKARARWVAEVTAVYPAGWLQAGGPYRTTRPGEYGHRHVPARSPFGGYDLDTNGQTA